MVKRNDRQFRQLKEIFVRFKTDDKADDGQPYFTGMSDLESEESAEQKRKQIGQGLKIFTVDQLLSRLQIALAQLKVGNNSKNLKDEIRQLLSSLYHSKSLTKTIIIWSIGFKNGSNIYEHWK